MDYVYGSAAVIGLQMLPVLGRRARLLDGRAGLRPATSASPSS